MAKFILGTSSTSDLSKEYCEAHDIKLLPFTVHMGEDNYRDYFEEDITCREFYDRMRAGAMATTSQISPGEYREFFEEQLKRGMDVVQIEFTFELSGSGPSATQVARELNEQYENKIYVINSVSASRGLGLLVHYAAMKRDEGMTAKELVDWVEEHKYNIMHWFTVDDLEYLRRGGRCSGAAAFMAGMLKIKPVLNVNDAGQLIPISKIRGRKKVFVDMVEKMKKDIQDPPEGQSVFIGHADCLDEVNQLVDLIKAAFPHITDYQIHNIGPVVGAHTGPGCIALFYYGSKRV